VARVDEKLKLLRYFVFVSLVLFCFLKFYDLVNLIFLDSTDEQFYVLDDFPSSIENGTKSSDVKSIIGLYLFGKKLLAVNTTSIPNEDVIETALNIKLRGIRTGGGNLSSSAIIEGDNGKQASYGVGDKLQGESYAVVYEIHPQTLILEREDGYERLTLFELLRSQNQDDNMNSNEEIEGGITTESVDDMIDSVLRALK